MEALAAIGLVSSILTFIDSGAKTISMFQQLHSSYSSVTQENADLARYAEDISEQAKLLKNTQPDPQSFEDRLIQKATECIDLSRELQDLLEKLKSTKPRSGSAAIKAVWSNFVKKGTKKTLEQRLDRCRQQFELVLVAANGSRTMGYMKQLIVSGAATDEQLNFLTQKIDKLSIGMKTISFGSEAMKQLHSLFERSDEAINATLQHKVLKYLGTDKLTERYDDLEPAHANTFSWLFDDEIEDPHGHPQDDHSDSIHGQRMSAFDRHRYSAKSAFTSWLREGQGIFYISGKPGAGKSTIMKFLCQHAKTRKHLQIWASEDSLVMAKFFFWKMGTKIQKSIGGLQRGLLYSTISWNADLLKSLFPRLYRSIRQYNIVPITNEDVEEAFHNLVNMKSGIGSYKFAFFIDGLDELDGDHSRLIGQLFKWMSLNPRNLKICVASREWPTFEAHLSKFPRIRLHEVTYKDISIYVRGKLKDNEYDISSHYQNHINHLAYEIVNKAEGVFLWAKLALANLLTGLYQGYSVEDLKERINELPSELDALYRSIFESIRTRNLPSERRIASRTFHLLKQYQPHYNLPPRSLFVYSFINDYDKKPDFALKQQKMTDEDKDRTERGAGRQITARCLGLVEYSELATESRIYRRKEIRFIHSSVSEFLDQKDIQAAVKSETYGFDWIDFWLQGTIAAAKAVPPQKAKWSDGSVKSDRSVEEKTFFLAMHQQSSPTSRALRLLQMFANICDQHNLFPDDGGYHRKSDVCQFNGGRDHVYRFSSGGEAVKINSVHLGWYPFFLSDGNPFLQEKDDLNGALFMESLLTFALHGPFNWTDPSRHSEKLNVLHAFAECLERYPNPNCPVPCCGRASVWHAFITSALMRTSAFMMKSARETKSVGPSLIEPFVRLFLLYGADSQLQFRLQELTNQENYHNLVSRFGEDQPEFVGTDRFSGGRFVDFCREHDGRIDLRQLVKLWFPGRRSEVLQFLIDRNLTRGRLPTEEEVKELKNNRSLDLDVREGFTFEDYEPLFDDSVYGPE